MDITIVFIYAAVSIILPRCFNIIRDAAMLSLLRGEEVAANAVRFRFQEKW